MSESQHCSVPSSSPRSSPVDPSMLSELTSCELNDAIRTYNRSKKLAAFTATSASCIGRLTESAI